jgi:hypothetical protein
VSGPSVFDMMEDLPTTNINVEQVDMNIEPNSADRTLNAGGNHLSSMDSKECASEVDVVVQDIDEENNEVLPPGNWKGVIEEDYDQLYRHFHIEYKDFDKLHCSYKRKI